MPALASVNDIYRVRASTQDIIKRALRLIGVLDPREPLAAEQLQDGLDSLNDLVDSWNTEKLMVPSLSRNTFTLTAGKNPHEIGPGADINVPRPERLLNGQVFLSGGSLGDTERPIAVISQETYGRIILKTISSLPLEAYYEASFPNGKLHLNFVPDVGYTLILYLEEYLQQILSDGTTTQLALRPGYKDALVHNLAIRLAPEYGQAIAPAIVAAAVETKASIKRANKRDLALWGDSAWQAEREGLADVRAFISGE